MGELESRRPEQRFYRISIERRYQTGPTPQPVAAIVECWAWDYFDALKTVLEFLAHNPPEPSRDDAPVIHRVARIVKGRATAGVIQASIEA